MINHGLSTGGLFALVGMIYERYHTREIAELGGLARRTPLLAFFMLLFTLSSIGLPGLNGFAGEFLILLGMFQRAWTDAPRVAGAGRSRSIAVLAVFGVVLGAWYMLWLVQRVFFGPLQGAAAFARRARRCAICRCARSRRWRRWSCSSSGSACTRSSSSSRMRPTLEPLAPARRAGACERDRDADEPSTGRWPSDRALGTSGGTRACRLKPSTCCCRK